MFRMQKINGDINSMNNKTRHILTNGLNRSLITKKANTCCYLMWERAYINEYGDVFFCCLCKPGPIGNIYKHDLDYIWQKSKKAKFFRRMSLEGSLSCYSACTVLSSGEKEIDLGRFYRNQGDLAKAEAALKDVLEINPKNHYAYLELGLLYKDQKRYIEAKEFFEKTLELNPTNPAAYAGLGWLYKNQGRYAESEAFFKKSLQINPNTEGACLGLGWLYKDQGKLKEAEQLARKELELYPKNKVAQVIIAEIHNGAPPELKSVGAQKDDADYPRTLQIMVGTFCPISCVMCPQDHRLKIAIDNKLLKENIDWSRIGDILIQGGEILAMPSAKELYVWLTEHMHKKINLVTNGLLINREWAGRLVRNSDWIEVSVNASTKQTHEFVNRGSNFDRVIRNIKMLIDLKHDYNIKTEIRYHFTIVPGNFHEIARAIKFADQLGCDMITYCFDSPNVEFFLSQQKKIMENMKDEIAKVINGNLKIKIQHNHLGQLGLIENLNSDLIVDSY